MIKMIRLKGVFFLIFTRTPLFLYLFSNFKRRFSYEKIFITFSCISYDFILFFRLRANSKNTSETASSLAETAASMVTKSDLTNTAKLKIVTTIFPEYDWVKSILGDQTENVELTMLLDNGVDLHSYQPTADDIAKISDCDLFIYVGGESDGWVDDALKNASNKNMKVVNLLNVLGDNIKEEEVVEGMETEAEEEEADGEEAPEYDEHVWLSLKNTKTLCSAIASNLEAIDPDHADIYKTN